MLPLWYFCEHSWPNFSTLALLLWLVAYSDRSSSIDRMRREKATVVWFLCDVYFALKLLSQIVVPEWSFFVLRGNSGTFVYQSFVLNRALDNLIKYGQSWSCTVVIFGPHLIEFLNSAARLSCAEFLRRLILFSRCHASFKWTRKLDIWLIKWQTLFQGLIWFFIFIC